MEEFTRKKRYFYLIISHVFEIYNYKCQISSSQKHLINPILSDFVLFQLLNNIGLIVMTVDSSSYRNYFERVYYTGNASYIRCNKSKQYFLRVCSLKRHKQALEMFCY